MTAPVRHPTLPVAVDHVVIGGEAPIAVQSMTNTDTADIAATVAQVAALAAAGSELVRVTVDRAEAAKAVPYIKEQLLAQDCAVPLIGDFHYIGHTLLTEHPECAAALSKYRINPGNVGTGEKKDRRFAQMIEVALRHGKPVRIGGNWGSLDQELLTELMDANAASASPQSAAAIMRAALVQSVLESAKRAEELGLNKNQIILSAKVSDIQQLILVYQALAGQSDYALHLGLTEAGLGMKGTVAASIGIAILLQQGIGDTIRVSLTPAPGGERTEEVRISQEILQSLGLRAFKPQLTACPGCGRTTSTVFQNLAQEIESYIQTRLPHWRTQYRGFETLKLAVMGCIVNGPGESRHADIGISLPGTGETPSAPVFIDGKKAMTLKGGDLAGQFKQIIEDYVATRYGETVKSTVKPEESRTAP